jgi:hypothetical protein
MSEERRCEHCEWWKGFEWTSGECGWIEAHPVLSAAIPEKLKQRERFDGYECPTFKDKRTPATTGDERTGE